MKYHSGTVGRAITAAGRIMVILVFFAAVFAVSSFSTFAEDGPVLKVSIDGETARTYMSTEELAAIPDALTGPLDYSGYNSYPTFSVKHVKSGIRLDCIIEDACGKDVSTFDSSSVIRLKAPDGVATSFTFGQLFGSARYYYPNAEEGTDNKGGRALPEAYEGASEVPAVIDISDDDNTFRFGQIAPNEQNIPEFMKYMLGAVIKKEQTPGEIEITTVPAEKCAAVTQVIPPSGAKVKNGTEISLPLPSKADKRAKTYYILDPAEGDVPGEGCDFYYYSPFNWSGSEADLKEYINPPVLNGVGKHTLAVKVCAYGKQDSDVTYFEYTVLSEPARPVVKLTAGKKKITVKWKKIKGANGYVVYRSTKKSSGYKVIKTIKKGSTVSFTNKKLRKGKRYYYKVRAYKSAYGTKVFSKYSSVKSTKAK